MVTYLGLVTVIILIYYLTLWTFRHEGKPPEAQTGLFRERPDWHAPGTTPETRPQEAGRYRHGARSQRR